MSKFESSPIVQKFQQHLNKLPEESGMFIAGVSGGPDSMALLYIMHRLELDVTVMHCNYQVRGEDSDKDQHLVEEVCQLWNLECISVRLDPDERDNENFQLWARNRRYSIFRDLKNELEADYIVTAHHQDDQLETILQKVLRGSGISAWKGIKAVDGDLFRPLLGTDKSEIMTFVQEQHIPYRIDSSNEESTYARNFLRHQWFPALHDLFPGWEKNILKLPERAREYDAMSDFIFEMISDKSNTINIDPFLKLPEEIQLSMLFKFLHQNMPGVELSEGLLHEAMNITSLQAGKSIEIGGKYILYKDRDQIILNRTKDRTVHQAIEEHEIEKNIKREGFLFAKEKFAQTFALETLTIDAEKVTFPIVMRNWRDGDSIQPLGMKGTQLVSDHLANRKIRSSEKKNALVIESFDGTICAVIFPHLVSENQIGTISENVKCTQNTEYSIIIQKVK